MSSLGYRLERDTEVLVCEALKQDVSKPIIGDQGGFTRSFRVPGSGALASFPGDVIVVRPGKKFLMLENKWKRKADRDGGKKMPLKKEWIEKNRAEAIERKMIPLLVFAFKAAYQRRANCFLDDRDFVEFMNHVANKTEVIFASYEKAKMPYRTNSKSIVILQEALAEIDPQGECFIQVPGGYIFSFEMFLDMLKAS